VLAHVFFLLFSLPLDAASSDLEREFMPVKALLQVHSAFIEHQSDDKKQWDGGLDCNRVLLLLHKLLKRP